MRYLSAILLCGSITACTALPYAPVTKAEVADLLETQRTAWNQGDLAGFVSYYDPSMTFSGEEITRGTATLLSHYEASYPTAAERGTLKFTVSDVRALGSEHALVLGRYALERAAPATGCFSLVVGRTPDGLRVLHDHTSASVPAK